MKCKRCGHWMTESQGVWSCTDCTNVEVDNE